MRSYFNHLLLNLLVGLRDIVWWGPMHILHGLIPIRITEHHFWEDLFSGKADERLLAELRMRHPGLPWSKPSPETVVALAPAEEPESHEYW